MNLKTLIFVCLYLVVSTSNASPVYTHVGYATNSTNPSVWQHFDFDITSSIVGVTNAQLSFNLRNDGPPGIPDPTTTEVLFGIENSDYFVHLNYDSGMDASYWRDVRLNIDGILYLDQFGAFNNHLGDEFIGTAGQGNGPAFNVLGETGFDASTYIMSVPTEVPSPTVIWLFSLGLIGLFGVRKSFRNPD